MKGTACPLSMNINSRDRATLFLAFSAYTYQKELKSIPQKDTCTPMLIVALFTIDKVWVQPKYLSMDELIKKL